MKKLTTLILLLLSPLVIAQEKEVWACVQVKGAQINWENGSWERSGVTPESLLLTIDGVNSSYKQGDYNPWKLNCSLGDGRVSCVSRNIGDHIYLDPASGKMGISFLGGALDTGDTRDSVSAQIYNCTKF